MRRQRNLPQKKEQDKTIARNTIDGMNNRLEEEEEFINDIEFRGMESNPAKQKRGKKDYF